ncbi:protein boule-like [Chanos chanos]|uniref:Protein boule-like n=1 Tax=Chanos chanos TaxID=29144 RepID=A0A6J2V4L9_CHACN|nr:protein boule-like [Chanos chanos]
MENETSIQTSAPSSSPTSPERDTLLHHAPRFGTVIPNRIFVGGIDNKTNENDLRRFFSQYGTVKEVKIVIDRAGVSKGYGFVTFETPEDAQKILQDADQLSFHDKKLNIGQAVRKKQVGVPCGTAVPNHNPALGFPGHCGTMYLTTPAGYPYTYHNGVAYFNQPDISPASAHWPSRTVSGSPIMLTHPSPQIYPQSTCPLYQTPTQCVSGPLTWNFPQVESPVPSSPVLYVQPPEMLYHPMELTPDSGCAQPALPLVETTIPEPYVDHVVQQAYHQTYVQNATGIPTVIMPQEGGKEQRFYPMRRGIPHSVHLKSRYSRSPHYAHMRKSYRPDISELSPSAVTQTLK